MKVDRVVVATVVSWLDGHQLILAIAAGLAFWWRRSSGAAPAGALAAYAAVNVVGGFLTVLPLGWLPFRPEQTFAQYSVHFVYAECQIPLLGLALTRRLPGRARSVR